ncbi:MAG: 2-oxoacid:acceptor oxidoreductase subunit alpha [Thermodesulfobacteriota bacterium]|nr:2-oxoacid:acceptor oxidoreductase subunit alpha [Thermodesulfobacteriota bacterium]
MSKSVLTGQHFVNGDVACAEGAIACGCRFFAGYPITPATEVAERMAERLPQVGGVYIQMEDELASMAAILGASWGGMKAMTSTSGPGFSLMMENIGLGIITETPCVVVNVQRAGPSTGLPTLCGQGDIMQARWGSHGHYEIIALSPGSPQEIFDITILAFNLSEKYRLPVIILTDEIVGHMSEKVVIPDEKEIEIVNRKTPEGSKENYMPYMTGDDLVAPMAKAGDGYRFHITGLTHDSRGYPVLTPEVQKEMVYKIVNKIRKNRKDIIYFEEIELEGADFAIITYGISVRVALKAVQMLKNDGIKCGILKLITIWPFAEEKIIEICERVKGILVVEINLGQIFLEVKRCVEGRVPVKFLGHAGGAVFKPVEIIRLIKELSEDGKN